MMQAFMPATSEAAYKLAHRLANTEVPPKELRGKPDDIFVVIARCASVGIDWSQALQGCHVVHGRVGFSANMIAAICATSPEFEVFDILESTPTSCTVEAKKFVWAKARTYTVTLEDAKAAGFRSERWDKQPRVMLQNMAKREAGRMWNPAGLLGIYEREELEKQIIDVDATVAPVEPEPSRRVQHGEEAPVVQQKAETKVAALVRDKAREGAKGAGDEAVEKLTEDMKKTIDVEFEARRKKDAAKEAKKKAAAEKRKATLAKKKLAKELAEVQKEAEEAAREAGQQIANPPDDKELDLDQTPPWEEEAVVLDGPIDAGQVRELIDTMRKYHQSLPSDDKEQGRLVWDEFLKYAMTTFDIQNHTQIPANMYDVALETLETMIAEAMEGEVDG